MKKLVFLVFALHICLGHFAQFTPEDTLIIFDEIQEIPRALKSLKYFYEQAPQYLSLIHI